MITLIEFSASTHPVQLDEHARFALFIAEVVFRIAYLHFGQIDLADPNIASRGGPCASIGRGTTAATSL